MRILVTGASGFIGRRLIELAPPDWEVSAIWNRTPIKGIQCDLTDRRAVALLAREYDVVLALAANGDPVYSQANPVDDVMRTTVVSVNTFSHFRAKRLIYFSSGAVYEGLRGGVDPSVKINPILPYAISHYAAERYAEYFTGKNFDEAVVLRFFGAYGPCEPERKIYSRLVKRFAFERERSLSLSGDGKNVIDAMYIDDAVEAIVKVVTAPPDPGFRIFDLPGGNPMTIRSLVETAARTFGIDPILEFGGSAAEEHQFNASLESFSRRYDFALKTPLDEGLRRHRDWLTRQSSRS